MFSYVYCYTYAVLRGSLLHYLMYKYLALFTLNFNVYIRCSCWG